MTPPEHRAANRPSTSSRVLVFDYGCVDREAWGTLEARGFEVVSCPNSRALLEEVLQHVAGVVVFCMRADPAEDLGVLHLVRRVAPDVPLILLAANGSLDTRRVVQELRPIYYGVSPIEPSELQEAVTTVLDRPRSNP